MRPSTLKPVRTKCFFLSLSLLLVLAAESSKAARASAANLKCSQVFEVLNGSELALSENSKSLRAESAAKTEVKEVLSFRKILGKNIQITAAVTDSSAQRIALQFNDLNSKTWIIKVLDLRTGSSLFEESFTSISSFQFAGESSALLINGTKPSDGQVRKVYVRLLNKPNESLPSSAKELSTIDIPGSKYWGVDLKQFIVRKDLPFAVAVQDSMNPIADAPAPTDYNPYAVTSVSNQQTHLINPVNGKALKDLRYGALRPVSVQMNPASSLAALVLANPLVAAVKSLQLVIVDILNPNRILFTETADSAGLNFSKKGYDGRVLYNQSVRNDFISTWSSNGDLLLIAETATGQISIYDSKANKIIFRHKRDQDSRWPIQQVLALNPRQFLILREGHSQAGAELSNSVVRELSAELLDLDAKVNPTKAFPLKVDTSDQLFQTYHRVGRIEAFWFAKSRSVAVALDGQIIRVPIGYPENQQTLVTGTKQRNVLPILSVNKADQESIVFATEQGVFRWKM